MSTGRIGRIKLYAGRFKDISVAKVYVDLDENVYKYIVLNILHLIDLDGAYL